MGNSNVSQNASGSSHNDVSQNASGSSHSSHYDVFINHRGQDVKTTIATSLYSTLLACGFHVFLDKPEMQVGDHINSQIKQAIESASIHIVIFSPTYAESSWCLLELHQMMMLNSKSDHAIIIPVFYGVTPSDVRARADGVYAEALRSHEKKGRCTSQTIRDWKDALLHAAGISGFELKACNGGDGELLGEIVGCVLDIREKRRLKCLARKDFNNIVLSHDGLKQSPKAMVVGIVGPGGVGKTTLAQQFFNEKRSGYSQSCFLYDVKENTTEGSLISMQKKLLKHFTKLDVEIDTIDQGINLLKKHILYCKVLIVVDDVDDANQLDALLPIRDALDSNSFILVTSRHKNVFERRMAEVSIYNLMELNTVRPRTNLVLAGYWLKALPLWLDQLTSLNELWLRDSPNLKRLSSSSQQRPLNQLTELTINDCGIESLSPELENMNNLNVLRVYNCPLGELSFKKLAKGNKKLLCAFAEPFPQGVYPDLQHLWINSCRSLVKVESFPIALITLDLSYCNRLRQIKGLRYLARLERLDISGCEEVEELPTIRRLKSLQELRASRCHKLKRIKGLAHLGTKLRVLYVRECRELVELPDVEGLMSLEKLDASRCPKLQFGSEVLAQLQQRLNARDGLCI